jgi:hypothetical protein
VEYLRQKGIAVPDVGMRVIVIAEAVVEDREFGIHK